MNGQFTLESLLKLLRRNLHILFGWMVGCLIVTALFTFFIMEPKYQSTSRIVVNQTESGSSNLTSTDISTNISLMRTYQNIILEPIILEDVITQTNTNNTVDELRSKIQFENEDESLVFGLSVTENDPNEAAELANATSTIFQSKIGDILPVESVTILSAAIPNSSPVSPNIYMNLIFGTALGFFIGLLQVLLRTLLDKRVKSDEIIADLGWLNLGAVSEMTTKELQETVYNAPEKTKQSNEEPLIESKRLEDGNYVRQPKEKA